MFYVFEVWFILQETVIAWCIFRTVPHFEMKFFVWSESRVPIYMEIRILSIICRQYFPKVGFCFKIIARIICLYVLLMEI